MRVETPAQQPIIVHHAGSGDITIVTIGSDTLLVVVLLLVLRAQRPKRRRVRVQGDRYRIA